MLSMQYQITLPSDYNMEIIKERVRRSGNKTDGFPGLKMKAYLIAEKEKYGNSTNQYAPFYLWNNAEGLNQFLLGGPFNNILTSFGRPRVDHWIVIREHLDKEIVSSPGHLYAAVIKKAIDNQLDMTDLPLKEAEWADTAKARYAALITAYNPATWELCRFYMSDKIDLIKESGTALIYDVHHISA